MRSSNSASRAAKEPSVLKKTTLFRSFWVGMSRLVNFERNCACETGVGLSRVTYLWRELERDAASSAGVSITVHGFFLLLSLSNRETKRKLSRPRYLSLFFKNEIPKSESGETETVETLESLRHESVPLQNHSPEVPNIAESGNDHAGQTTLRGDLRGSLDKSLHPFRMKRR